MPSSENPTITLKTTHRSRHPWIYQRMVRRPKERLDLGAIVDVVDRNGEWVGRGFYNPNSSISVRLLTANRAEAVDEQFFKKRLAAALTLRRDLLALDSVTSAYRLVHAEGDGLTGLIADRFGDVIVLEFFSAGMYRIRELIMEMMREFYPGTRFVFSAEEHVERQEGVTIARGEAVKPVIIKEHGVSFFVEPGGKHKTGFFSDQRDNRLFLSSFCKGKRVLDLCCNTGGFAVYAAARGEAAEVLGIDLDEEAIELAIKNSKLNRAGVKFIQIDIFKWMREAITRGEKYDVVILDPSKQAREREEILPALKKYTDMNKLAMQIVAPGGLLLTCSCTGLVSEEQFIDSVRRAAYQAERQAQIFKLSGAGADHPFLTSALEGRYLKAVWARML